jgi:methyl-accepting chemotaxis protein
MHRQRFLETLESVRHSARLASSIAQVARENGEVVMSDGMLTRFEQVMLEQLARGADGSPIPAKDLADMSKSVAAAVGSRERFEAMRREFEQAKHKAAEAAEDAAKGGATGREVVERVREILGMPPLPPVPPPAGGHP